MTTKQIAIAMVLWSIMGGVIGYVIGYSVANRQCEDVLSRLEPQIQMSINR